MRLVIGISGASGVVLGYHMLKALKVYPECETHLVISEGAKVTFALETDLKIEDVGKLADFVYSNKNLAASISSGSFKTDGMIVIPCSMKTLSGIATGYAENLLIRAVDVCLKENRKVVLVPREMPFGKLHIRNMKEASDLGCVIIPPLLTFYNNPQTIEEQINHIIGKILMQFGLDHEKFKAWEGIKDDSEF
ncbi:4-hydroxybenzoate decarboxylase subunit B [Sedimentibacter sp.]|uniref:4-hydroxybenzoate decarboxylase subunit B n=1 Tax=Sedimentibacter sp. TaxID=1960295 RepID=UPI0037DA2925